MSYLLPDDHAFANGPVFPRPRDLGDAIAMTGGEQASGVLLQRIWRQFDAAAEIDSGVRLGLAARLINLGARERVSIGADTIVRGILRNDAAGSLRIGRMVYVGDGAVVSVVSEVVVGDATMLAHGVQIFDNDTHPMDARQREEHFAQILGRGTGRPFTIGTNPIRIGRRCWVGMNAIIMKGVSLGDEAVVGAGSVVTRNVEPATFVAGNPAVLIKNIH